MRKSIFLVIIALALCTTMFGASFSGTLNPPAAGATASLTWSGTSTGVISNTNLLLTPPCNSTICDIYTLTVNIPSTWYTTNFNYAIHVKLNWTALASGTGDLDVYVSDSSGNVVCAGNSSNPAAEDADCGQLPAGVYSVAIAPATAINQAYNGTITLQQEPTSTIQGTSPARYAAGKFTFTTQQLHRPAAVYNTSPIGPLFFEQDAEPRVAHDAVGNLYVDSIEAVPAGTGFWSSLDAGNTWTYLGQPDGAQAAAAQGAQGAGLGGGDEDLIVLPNGQLVMTSLWLGSNTTCVSSNGGVAWLCNPNGSTEPADDRQWLANSGNNVVYITSKQLGTLTNGTESIYVAKSIDGGKTFPFVSQVTTPELGVQPGDQGNIITDTNGNVYTVFFDPSGTVLYLAKSVDAGSTWMIKQVYTTPACSPTLCISMVHVFPSIAADSANNLYIVFSDGTNSYLTTSQDGGATWKLPAIVQGGFNLKTTVEPWVVAGDPGKINIFYYGTSSRNFMDPSAQWEVFMAQTQNAFDRTPKFSIAPATGVIHVGAICNNGTGCPSGTRTMLEYFFPDTYLDGTAMAVYPDSENNLDKTTTLTTVWFLKQTSGTKIVGH